MSTLLTIAAVTGAFSIAGVITLLVTYLYGKGYRWQAPIQWLSYDVDTGEWVRSKELKRRRAAVQEKHDQFEREQRAAAVERDIASLHEVIFQAPHQQCSYCGRDRPDDHDGRVQHFFEDNAIQLAALEIRRDDVVDRFQRRQADERD